MLGSFRLGSASLTDAEEASREELDMDSAEDHSRSSLALMNMQHFSVTYKGPAQTFLYSVRIVLPQIILSHVGFTSPNFVAESGKRDFFFLKL